MAELLLVSEEALPKTEHEAFAQFDQPISLDSEGRCTPNGWNVDYDD